MDKKELIKKVKELFFEVENQESEKEETENKFMDVTTDQGLVLRVTDMVVGAEVSKVEEEEVSVAEDGEYLLEDGVKIVVLEGVISEIVEAEEESEESEEVSETEEFDKEIEKKEDFNKEEKEDTEVIKLLNDLKTELTSVREDFKNLKEENVELKNRFNKFADESSEDKTETKVDFSTMERNDKLKFFSKK